MDDKQQNTEESIVVDGLRKSYGDVDALRGIDFGVRSGEIVGFLGPNGAGKTTTMKILTGFMAATDGHARVAGFDVHRQSDQVRKKIGYLPENVPLYDEMLVYDYLRFIAEVQEVKRAHRDERIDAVAELTGIDAVMGRTISELSKGYRQRVGLAQAIIHEPEVIILDEPTTGLDPNQIVEIRDVITTIGQEKTIIFSTHIMQEVTAVCDRIIIIDDGELVADGTLDELEEKALEATPGVMVSFEGGDEEDLRNYLEGLGAVTGVVDVSGRQKTHKFRLLSDDISELRKAIIDGESRTPRGLLSLRAAEPTLEEIFRLYTAKNDDEQVDEEVDGEEEISAEAVDCQPVEKPEEVAGE